MAAETALEHVVVNVVAGELLDVEAAERRASFICTDLDAAAAGFEAAMASMRLAITARDDVALGYRSPGDYISDRFGGRLARLGVDLRREVVRELTAAGLSTRAIAPVVGVSQKTVVKDRQVIPEVSPDGEAAPAAAAARPVVVGIDGKSSYRPPRAPEQQAPHTPRRRPLPDRWRDATWELTKAVEKLERLTVDDRFAQHSERLRRSDVAQARETLARVAARFEVSDG